ncbi:MAG: undecaprenyl-diphosphatase UppP [Chloroflexi bacterium]|nr:undecaprenyl-diphosphatase UppP [Chloroflexota bacterium]
MNFLQALVLGIIQGLTEFLPVSSSGHLVVVPWLLGWPQPDVMFDAMLHLGTVVALLVAFWRDIIKLIVGWFNSIFKRGQPTLEGRLAWLLILSAVPAAILGFLFNDLFESLFGTPRLVAILLLVTAFILWVSEKLSKRERTLESLTWVDALLMGMAQGIAIAPGISRSGATLASGLIRGLKREDTARFSFLMAIPVIIGASGYKLLDASITSSQLGILLVGFLAALISGFLVIRAFLNFVRGHSLKPFAWYCACAGVAALVLSLVKA